MEDWFRWLMGGLVGIYSGVTGFVIGLIIHDRKKLAELESRLAVIEARSRVDPVSYMRFITEVKHTLESIVAQIAEAHKEREEIRELLQQILAAVGKKELTR